jgi:hypothetical protein
VAEFQKMLWIFSVAASSVHAQWKIPIIVTTLPFCCRQRFIQSHAQFPLRAWSVAHRASTFHLAREVPFFETG